MSALDSLDGRLGNFRTQTAGVTLDILADALEPGTELPDQVRWLYGIPSDYQDYVTSEAPEVKKIGNLIEFRPEPPEVFDKGYLRDLRYATDRQNLKTPDGWQKPEEYLQRKKGDCEDYALAMASLGNIKDYDTRIVIGALDGQGHVLTEIKLDEEYFIMSVGDPDRLRPRDRFEDTHEWNQALSFGSDESLQVYEPDW